MEIKNLIERLDDWDGVDAIYKGGFVEVNHYGVSRLLEEAAAALEQLQAENDRLKRERDAAVESWRGFCSQCAWKNHQYLADGKMDDMCRTCRDNAKCNWKWRGPKEE